jgi:hypothetical protein
MLAKSLFRTDSQQVRANQSPRVVEDLHHRDVGERPRGHGTGLSGVGYGRC